MKPIPAASFGLIAWLENTRIVLPLKGVETTFDVRGDLVSVELCQIYHQNNSQPLDVTYTFPLPGGAAVYRCEMIVNDRVIAAKVMEVDEARQLAAEKKAAGHRTALVESVRENLFELALGNLAPGDTVVIRLAWFQTLDTAGHDRSFRIPFTPGVRYIPGTPLLRSNSGKGIADDTAQVPDASRLTPPRIDQFHPDAAWASIEGRIQLEGVDAAHIASPTHTLILREADNTVTARLAGTGEVPDRDFVLRLPASSPAVLTPAAWITRENGYAHALVRIIAPATAPATQTARDVYFLVDRSGSMAGANWTATCKAFRAFLKNLAPQDRAWVTFFESDYRDLAEKPLPPAAILAEPIVQKLEDWNTGGGTELLPALDHVLTVLKKHSAQRNPAIVIITDGQVGNEETIIERMKPLPEVRVFCYGIDAAVNDAFLRRLATQQRGACCLATPQEDLVGAIASLAARLRHPVFTSLQPPDGWELPAGAIPDLFAAECLTVSLRGPAEFSASALTFAARDGNGAPALLTCPVRPVHDPAISRLWAKQRIESLLATNERDAAIALSIDTNIVCPHTAYIAWDEAERLAVTGPNREIYQPSMGGSRPQKRFRSAVLYDVIDACPEEPFADLCEAGGAAPGAACYAAPPPPSVPAPCPAPATGSSSRVRSFFKKAASPRNRVTSEAACAEPSDSLIQSKPSEVWRGKLAALTTIQLSAPFLDWLDQWLWSDISKISERRRLLEELAASLATHSTPVNALIDWLTAHLEPAFRQPALQELNTTGIHA